MKLIKVAAAVVNQTPLDWKNNAENILQSIEIARNEQVSILCLPEMCITGYGCEDAFSSLGIIETASKILFEEILPKTKNIIISVGLPFLHQNCVFNAACLIANQKVLGFVFKQHLAGDSIYYEPRWFKPWPQGISGTTNINGKDYSVGDLYFNLSGIKIGYEICEDAWVAQRPGGELARKGIDIILNPSASHFEFGKQDIRMRFVLEGSRAFGVSYIHTNLLGCEAGRAIYDGSALIATGGKLVAYGKRFSFENAVVTSSVVDISHTRINQIRTASFQPDLEFGALGQICADFDFPPVISNYLPISICKREAWEESSQLKEEEFTHSVSLGLFDYLRKSKSQGFIISLSGGADSSAVACLVFLMIQLGILEIGKEKFLKKLEYISLLKREMDVQQMVKILLTCVYQKTKNSSDTTQIAACKVTEDIGAEFIEFNIDPIVKNYVEMVSQSLDRDLSWKTDDLALQNIQARVRAPGAWLLANVKRKLLLTTSNRSEAAVGYATMDGDTCGGLSPIGGIDKAFLRQWLKWMETIGPNKMSPISSLSYINNQEPTAELKPKKYKQTDEKDLMPYLVLDIIERAAIRDKKTPLEVFIQLKFLFEKKYLEEDLKKWVQRFFHLWCMNQWKRERYAPSFHLDDESLDPKTWCRFPILSGNFERELEELNFNSY